LIEVILGDGLPMARRDFIDKLMLDLDSSERTIEGRLKELENLNMPICNNYKMTCVLIKERRGKGLFYSLSPMDQESADEE
jgi:hypothetical protein